MRKFIALALVALMMLAIVPTAFAATGDVNVVSNTAKYYSSKQDPTTKPVEVKANGGIAYVQEKFENFLNWQVPGNSLTGNALSWGKWIEVSTVLTVKGIAAAGVMIDGLKYGTDANGTFTFTYYALPVVGGNTVTRTLQIYNAAGTALIDRANLSMMYEDMYTPKGSVTTEGINQANTSATIDKDGNVVISVVFKNLVASYSSTNATNAGYVIPSYFPIRFSIALLDKDGNKYPAFTRVDLVKVSNPDMKVMVDADTSVDEVPNMATWMYLTEASTLTLEKRFNAKGTQLSALEVYKERALNYAGYNTNGVGFRTALGAAALPFSAGGGSYGGLDTIVITGQPFNPMLINSWTTADVRSSNQVNEPANETALKAVLDAAIMEYYADPNNSEVYGTAANALDRNYPVGKFTGSTLADLTKSVQKFHQALLPLGGYDSSVTITADADKVKYLIEFYKALVGAGYDATRDVAGHMSLAIATAINTAYSASNYNIGAVGSLIANSGYEPEYLQQAMYNNQVAGITLPTSIYAYDLYIAAINDVRTRVNTAMGNTLQPNANLFGNTIDEIQVRLTKPTTNEVSTQTITVKYNSVDRIVAKALTVLEGQSITIVKGETKAVTVKAYQDQVAVTGLPIKFVSNDTNIATATSPNTQAVNTNTTEITGVTVGSTFVKAYLDTPNDKAEAYIMVNVVEAAPEVPATPETTEYVCKVRKLWIRTGAGTSYDKAGYYSRNDVAKVYEVVNGWAKVDYNGTVAYASTGNGKYLAPK